MANGADRRVFWSVTTAVLILDAVTKVVAERFLARRLPLEVIGDYVQLRLVYNEGAAFGLYLGEHSRWLFFVLAIVARFVLGSMVRATRPGDRLRFWSLALLCGGPTGNLIDRIRSADGVVDFLDVGVGMLRWPTFNVADSAITIGAIALAVSLWLEGREQQSAKEARLTEP